MASDLEQPLLRLDANTSKPPVSKFFTWLTFGWIAPVLRKGATEPQLHLADLPPLPPNVSASSCGESLWQNLKEDQECNREHSGVTSRISLLYALFKSFGWQLLKLGGIKLLDDALSLLLPILLNGLLAYLESTGQGNHVREGGPGSLQYERGNLYAVNSEMRSISHWGRTFAHRKDGQIIGKLCGGMLVLSLLAKVMTRAKVHFANFSVVS